MARTSYIGCDDDDDDDDRFVLDLHVLYRGCQFYRWRKPEYTEKTTTVNTYKIKQIKQNIPRVFNRPFAHSRLDSKIARFNTYFFFRYGLFPLRRTKLYPVDKYI